MDDVFYIYLRLNSSSAVKALNDQILSGSRKGYNNFYVIVRQTATYSNVCAPIAGILDFYRTKGFTFEIFYEDSPYIYASHTKFECPSVVEDNIGTVEMNYPFDKVWKFSSSEAVNALTSAYILALRQADIVEDGVIGSLDWCLNETMDNILQHSQANCGYIMAQLLRSTKQFSVCVFDTGIGIYNSLKSSKHRPSAPLDAITLALQERVTRDENIGQGNGLWGLSQLIREGKGLIRVCSAGAYYQCNPQETNTVNRGYFNLGPKFGTTLIDFQLNYSDEINIAKALNGYEGPLDYWLENLESENGDIKFMVAEHSSGTGTRKAAEKFKNVILNVAITEKKKVILDFSGVNLVSSSYADELVGKIISKYGFMFFISKFKIVNMSPFNASVLNRSVGQRLAQTYYDNQIEDIPDEKYA